MAQTSARISPAMALPAADKVAARLVNPEIARNGFFILSGPSGCGKTALLRRIGDFEQPTGGSLAIFGQDMTCQPPESRPVKLLN